MKWYIKCLKHYSDFRGRANRKECWYFILINLIIGLLFSIIDEKIGWVSTESKLGVLTRIYDIVIFLPSIAVCVRRLHDIGKSGWNFLFFFIPIVGTILIIVWLCRKGDSENNAWGANPDMNSMPDNR